MKSSPRLLDGMPYTPAAQTTVDYLRAKFKKIQREIEDELKAAAGPRIPAQPEERTC